MAGSNQGRGWWEEIGGKEIAIGLISALIIGFGSYVTADLSGNIEELKSEAEEKDVKISEANSKLAGLMARIESVEKKDTEMTARIEGVDTKIAGINEVMRESAEKTKNLLLKLIVEKSK